jgi:cobalt-zinc-cadmium efflux system outer membrane protein
MRDIETTVVGPARRARWTRPHVAACIALVGCAFTGCALAGCGGATARRHGELERDLEQELEAARAHRGPTAAVDEREPDDDASADTDDSALAASLVVAPLASASLGSASLADADGALDRSRLIARVLERNPTLDTARRSWSAALARYDRVTALPDPRLEYAIAPLSIAGDAHFGQTIRLQQSFPWFGTLSSRGDAAVADAEAARAGLEAARLELALAASTLYDAYFANGVGLALLDEHHGLLLEVGRAVEARLSTGAALQSHAYTVEIEQAHLDHQRVRLAADRAILVAQLNALLRRAPERPLPPPPAALPDERSDLPATTRLQQIALERRPEVHAALARIAARQADIRAARAAYGPGIGVMGSYDSMWPSIEHQLMVGVSIELPLALGARGAAVDEASAELEQARSELAELALRIRTEVETARQRVQEAQHVARLYEERLVPLAHRRIDAAHNEYATGQAGLQDLLAAERSLRTAALELAEARAQLGQQRAALDRALGTPMRGPRVGQGARPTTPERRTDQPAEQEVTR